MQKEELEWIWGEKFISVENSVDFDTINENGFVKKEEIEMRKIQMKRNITMSVLGNIVNTIQRDVQHRSVITEVYGQRAEDLITKPLQMEQTSFEISTL